MMDAKAAKKSRPLLEPTAIADELGSLRAPDAVDALDALDHPTAVSVLEVMPLSLAVQLFDEAGLDHPYKIIALLPEHLAAAILNEISADRRTDIFRKLSEPDRERLSRLLPRAVQDSLRQLLTYAPDTAGGMMTTEFLTLAPEERVEEALRQIRQEATEKETIYSVYVVDPSTGRLIQPLGVPVAIQTLTPFGRRLHAAAPNSGAGRLTSQRKLELYNGLYFRYRCGETY
jgi:magnesium transporter